MSGVNGAQDSGADDEAVGGDGSHRDAVGEGGPQPSVAGSPDSLGDLLDVYRTLPARILGWVMVAVIATVGFVIVRSEYLLGRNVLVPLAGMLLVIALIWVFLLRPAVELRSASVTSRNILRDTVVPFSRLASVDFQWSLEVTDTAGRTWSSWAVPKQREFSARRAFDDFGETTRAKSRPGTTAQVVAGDVERAYQRWLFNGGSLSPNASAHTAWALQAIVPLVGAVAFLAIALALG
ncbi:MAG: hypothetical protein WA991_02630 [Ornithinimicrobium sp.]